MPREQIYLTLVLSLALIFPWTFSSAQVDTTAYFPENYEKTADNSLPARKAEKLYEQGLKDSNLGYMEEALKSFNEAIALKPDFDHAYFDRAQAREALKDIQ